MPESHKPSSSAVPPATVRSSSPRAPLTLRSMRDNVAAQIGEAPDRIAPDEDLIGRGLDSLGIMGLANMWRRQGVELSFADLLGSPTLNAWWRLVSRQVVKKQLTTTAD